jgi:hypothetical protein
MHPGTQISKKKKFNLQRAKVVREQDKSDTKTSKLNKKDTIFIDEDLKSKLEEINRKNKKEQRSFSSEIDTHLSRRYIWQKRAEYLKEEENNKEGIIIEAEEIENFFTESYLYDKITKKYLGGKLLVDKSHILKFFPEKYEEPLYFNHQNGYYSFPLLLISKCFNNTKQFDPSKYCKEIILKDNRNFVFKFTSTSFKKFEEIIDKYSLPLKSKGYFNCAYSNKLMNKNNYKKYLKIYNIVTEFKRQGVYFSDKVFRLLDNSDFKFCETYPKKLVVPYDMSDEELKESANFRTKNRVPTLTYRYHNGCCIWRSSQTKSGFNSVNKYDIELISRISDNANLKIYDARPYANAMANKLKGAGFENINDYKNNKINVDLEFCGIGNIHVVRNSYYAMLNKVSYNISEESNIYTNIAESKWYDVIITILKSSFQIYNSIFVDNNNILIHCSDGWDRTSQLCALSQILLDKYYRTLDGFICLIEKDWISFGHQFRYRNGLYSPIDSKVSESQFSPIFIQWLDCIYQIMEQNYTKFQFNFKLLTFLAEEVYAGKYGTFLFNNEKEREMYDAENKTLSIWNYVKENEDNFINYIYDPEDNGQLAISYKRVKLWSDYFCRFEKGGNGYLYEFDKKNKKEKMIIEKFCQFITSKCKKEDIDKIDYDCKTLINQFIGK